MNRPKLTSRAPLLFVAALTVGCQSPRTARIQAKAALFASLDPFSQRLIREGLFNFGFTAELVDMALGKPNGIVTVETPKGPLETWTYKNFLYDAAAAVKFGINNPGTRHQGPLLSPNAPGGPSLSSTKASPVQPMVSDGSDAPVGTLYLDFLDGRVVAARLKP